MVASPILGVSKAQNGFVWLRLPKITKIARNLRNHRIWTPRSFEPPHLSGRQNRQGANGYVLSMGTKIWDPEQTPEQCPEQGPEQRPEWTN